MGNLKNRKILLETNFLRYLLALEVIRSTFSLKQFEEYFEIS